MLATSMHPLPSHIYPRPSDPDRATTSHPASQSSPCQPTLSPANMLRNVASNATSERRSTIPSRPKLTLQTTSLPMARGTSSTGLSLSLAAGATASPTVRNTFRNAYDATCPPSATASPSSKSSGLRFSRSSSPYPISNNSGPYQQPIGVKSILRNSPLEPTSRRRSVSLTPNGSNGGSGSRRVFFPAGKRVSYRYPLEEEIKTVRYTARHSDLMIESSLEAQNEAQNKASPDHDSESNSSSAPSDTSSDDDNAGIEEGSSTLSQFERKKRRSLGSQRQVRAAALLDGLEAGDPYSSSTPQSSQRRRVKRRCEWRWTLGPLEKQAETTELPQTPNDATSKTTIPATSPVSVKETKLPEEHTESPVSWTSCDTFLSSTSQRLSSPISSVASHYEKNDESKRNTTHEVEHEETDRLE